MTNETHRRAPGVINTILLAAKLAVYSLVICSFALTTGGCSSGNDKVIIPDADSVPKPAGGGAAPDPSKLKRVPLD